jgi:UPF0755 protein
MHDIIPTRPKKTEPPKPAIATPVSDASQPMLVIDHAPTPIIDPIKKKRKKSIILITSIFIGALILIAAVLTVFYNINLQARGGTLQQLIKVSIKPGTTPSQIGQLLQDNGVIKSSFAFDTYTRLSGTHNKLQAGTYRLSPAETVPQIVDHLVKGRVDQFSIRFLPGATLKQDRQVLLDAGFSASNVDTGLSATYDTPLFATKPAGTDLEGYIYGETYNFNSGVTVRDILQRSFDQFESVVVDNNLVDGFTKQGLSLYQGITLASIIQREVHDPSDQKQVAQIFYKRLSIGVPLGSDVTYIYAADKLGVTATPTLDSPYNTRINAGLPPGPIAAPGLTALQAVASPANGNYLFFLSGDDGITYYAATDAEHQANIAAHCQIKCSQ